MSLLELMFASSNSFSIFSPAAPEARAIAHLFIVSLGICGAIFAVVAGLAVYNLARFRWRPGDETVQQIHGNRRLELIWTIVPALILAVLFALTLRAMPLADPPLPAPADVQVIGHQWWWEIRYAGSGVVTANEIHIPIGRPISIQLDTVDVLHEFWVPQLTRKMTTVPNAGNHVWLEAEKAGVYEGLCSEFCGAQHAWMRFQVIAETPADYARWAQTQLERPATAAGQALRGRELFRTLTCSNCHSIQGTAAGSTAGPDLTHFASRRYLGARVAANTAENVRRWLRNPQAVKPGVLMPNFNLTDPELDELTAYCESLK